jgi:alpha-beta hydrolase superfamily lysophospholipase
VATVLVVALAVAGGAGPSSATPARSTDHPMSLDAFYRAPDPMTPEPPGTMIRSERLPASAEPGVDARVYRVLYHSRSMTGADTAVSGIVAVPNRRAPSTGYPVLSWSHATTGIADTCAPSRQASPSIPFLQSWIAAGYVVAATDYEGLGTAGIHPYLVGVSEGRSVLDAARAARHLVGSRASDKVAIDGHSQGGHAALFAGQLAHTYAPDLDVVGVVAIAPVSNVASLAPSVPGTAPDVGAVVAIMALAAWSKTYPDMPLDLALTGEAGVKADATISTECAPGVGNAFSGTPADQIFQPGWSATPVVADHIAANDPGAVHTASPILVVQGGADPLITAPTTEALVDQRLCRAQHDTVRFDLYPGDDHGTVLTDSGTQVAKWIAARFAGTRATSTCGHSRLSTG